jgi:thymidylate kinase
MTILEKRPFFVELLGTPEAGKTTVIRPVANMLEEKGYKVKVLQEAAEQIPVKFPRNSLQENIWIRTKTLLQTLEASVSDFDIILVDRGIIDTLIWNEIYRQKGELTSELCTQIDLLCNESLKIYPNFCINLFVPVEVAIERRHGEGRIVTRKFVENFNTTVNDFLKGVDVPQLRLDTSNITPEECEKILTKAIINQKSQ